MDKNHCKENLPSSMHPEVNTCLISNDCNIQYGGISTKDHDDDVKLIGSDIKKSTFAKVGEFVTTLTIEPVVFGFMFAFLMNMSVLSNMMMDKGCLYYFNYTEEVCRNLSNYDSEKEKVEALATTYSLYANLTSLIAAFMMTFIAPWSDKYGRRLPLLVAVAGSLLTDLGLILCTVNFESRLLYLVVSRMPSEFSGGFICMLAIIFSHASEVSSPENRTLKYTSVEIALGLGMALGGLTGGFLYRYYGYFYVYLVVAAVHIFCFVWVLCVVQETTGLDVRVGWLEKARDFFTSTNFKAGFVTTCRAREGNTKVLLLFLLASMCMIVFNYEAFGAIAFVYVHHVYNWDPSIYNVANTTASISGLVASVVLVPIFIRIFKIRDFTLGVIGTLSMMGKNLLIAFSKYHTSAYYTGLAFGVLTPLSGLAVRSGISKLVERKELGRVFSFLATCEAVMPMLGTIVVAELFNSTMDIFPSVTYSVGATLLLLPLGTFIWALHTIKTPYSELNPSVNDDAKEKA